MNNKNSKLHFTKKWLASPEDVNEFESHFREHRDLWDKAFEWLSTNDLLAIEKGKYAIDGENVFATVAEYVPADIEITRFEAHKKYIDIQYVARGQEKIGVAPVTKGIAISGFDEGKDIGFFEIPETDCKYYIAKPDMYFIFFPGDAHRPGIKTGVGGEVRKIVVKVMV